MEERNIEVIHRDEFWREHEKDTHLLYQQINNETPWEIILRCLIEDDIPPEVAKYITRQINLRKELEQNKCTECHTDEVFETVLVMYATYYSITESMALMVLFDKTHHTIDELFGFKLEKLINRYNINKGFFAKLLRCDRSFMNRVLSGVVQAPKTLVYSACLIFELDMRHCEKLFCDSPHTLHQCIPDFLFREYVSNKEGKGVQPFVDKVKNYLDNNNESLRNFYDMEAVHSCYTISDFLKDDGTYETKNSYYKTIDATTYDNYLQGRR